MNRIAVQIPVKTTPSTRVPNKNFRKFGGYPLWEHTVRECQKLPENWTIFIDTDDTSKFTLKDDFSNYPNTYFHVRHPFLAQDWANGNHLLSAFAHAHPGFDIYVQKFITAPFLKAETMIDAVACINGREPDSVFSATQRAAWVWFDGNPVNYNPDLVDGLPRSQDAEIIVETTGLYAITRESIFRRHCRIGDCPQAFMVYEDEAFDIDTESDWTRAEAVVNR